MLLLDISFIFIQFFSSISLSNPLFDKPLKQKILKPQKALCHTPSNETRATTMASSISADLATAIIGLTSRRSPAPLSRVRTTTHFPLLWSLRPKTISCSYSTSSFRSTLLAQPNRGFRRLTVASSAATTSQSESSDVTTLIPPDNRIPATIITGFLGSGKV